MAGSGATGRRWLHSPAGPHATTRRTVVEASALQCIDVSLSADTRSVAGCGLFADHAPCAGDETPGDRARRTAVRGDGFDGGGREAGAVGGDVPWLRGS